MCGLQKYATLVEYTRGCCSRADCGMSVDATCALEQEVDVAHRSPFMSLAGSNPQLLWCGENLLVR